MSDRGQKPGPWRSAGLGRGKISLVSPCIGPWWCGAAGGRVHVQHEYFHLVEDKKEKVSLFWDNVGALAHHHHKIEEKKHAMRFVCFEYKLVMSQFEPISPTMDYLIFTIWWYGLIRSSMIWLQYGIV